MTSKGKIKSPQEHIKRQDHRSDRLRQHRKPRCKALPRIRDECSRITTRYKPASEFPDGVEVVRDLDRIFKECDYVSLHCPNTPVTKNMVNKERLAMMKPTAFLINTARGGCVDEDALYEACKNGVIAGAGLDAIKKEPVDPANPLLTLDNVIIYPHIGGNTSEAAHRVLLRSYGRSRSLRRQEADMADQRC